MVDTMSIRCHERDRFLKHLDWLHISGPVIIEKLDLPKQRLIYKRTDYIALYKITVLS